MTTENNETSKLSPLREIRKKATEGGNNMTMSTPPPAAIAKRSPLRKRTYSAPAKLGRRRRSLVEEHYRMDPNDKTLLPGSPVIDEDWDRDLHDFFNLVSLVPVCVLNILNWNWDILLDPQSKKTLQQAWTGEWFPLFFAITIGYFVADLIWVMLVPTCVKSPGVIIQHHAATLLYLIIPYRFPEETGWLMGACLCVEVNTWLLIARRVFNKQGFGPWVIQFSCFSIRIKLISIFFYITWVIIRCAFYPSILTMLWELWYTQWLKTGAIFYQKYSVALLLHSVFCVLNLKWTYDLFSSKWRAIRSGKQAKIEKGL